MYFSLIEHCKNSSSTNFSEIFEFDFLLLSYFSLWKRWSSRSHAPPLAQEAAKEKWNFEFLNSLRTDLNPLQLNYNGFVGNQFKGERRRELELKVFSSLALTALTPCRPPRRPI